MSIALSRRPGRGMIGGVAKTDLTKEEFAERRRREQLAFLVVKFLMAWEELGRIYADFKAAEVAGSLPSSSVFERVRALEGTLAFDIKEAAHKLFRTAGRARAERRRPGSRVSRRELGEFKRAIEGRSIDVSIGTGYHLLAALRESLYQLVHYAPEHAREMAEMAEIDQMARRLRYTFSPEEAHELDRLRGIAEVSMRLSAETRAMARRMMARCYSLFKSTAQLVLGFIEGAAENEILVQNLLLRRELLERVYGVGASERIFTAICRDKDVPGATGYERAVAWVRRRCGNSDGL